MCDSIRLFFREAITVALTGKNTEEKIWNYLLGNISNEYGVAALMGNLEAESGLMTTNLQDSTENRLNYTDETYTAAVDSGKYTNFAHDSAGYGLAQWTYSSRKQGLIDYVRSAGKSIGDLGCQLAYLMKELTTSYKSVLNALKTATSVKAASDVVLKDFEKPKIQTEKVKEERSAKGQRYYDLYSKGKVNSMSVRVGSARVDENGKLTGGEAGDQTGTEVSTQAYYMHSKGWYLLRPKDVSVANAIANAMQNACDNDNIGYCQGHRTTVITQLKKYGSMVAIAEKTEADCSSLVRGCCIEAGFDPGNFTTANEATALANTGKFESKVSVTSSTTLYNGDILVTKTKGHTVVVVSGNPRIGIPTGGTSTSSGKTLITKLQSARFKDSKLAGTYKTTVNLDLRYGPDKDKYDSMVILPTGTKCRCYGYYTLTSGVKWLYAVASVNGKQYTGFVSMEYLAK